MPSRTSGKARATIGQPHAAGKPVKQMSTLRAIVTVVVSVIALLIVAMGAGSFFASHVNDSGFWLVGGLLQVDTATNLRLWTVFTSVISLTAFAVTALLYLVV